MESIDYELIGNVLEEIHPGVTIADGNGVFVFAGEKYLRSTGLAPSQILGKSAGSREISEMFSPCVTNLVFEQRKKITTIQRDLKSTETLVTGTPVFDDNGSLKMIICYSSWEINSYEELQRRCDMLNSENMRLHGEIERLVRMDSFSSNFVRKSRKALETASQLRIFSDADCPAYIYGPAGSGKKYLAKLFYSEKGSVGSFNCKMLDEQTIERELFGTEGIISSTGYRAVAVEGIDSLSPAMQRRFTERFSQCGVIPIGISEHSLEELKSVKAVAAELFNYFKPFQVQVHSVNECPEDIKSFIDYYLEQFNRRYSRNVRLLPRALNCLLGFEWKENIDEIRYTIERLVLTAENVNVNVYNLPKEITRQSAEIFTENAALKDMLEFYESAIINQTYDQCRTTVAVAKKLGISQASAVRKIQKYVDKR